MFIVFVMYFGELGANSLLVQIVSPKRISYAKAGGLSVPVQMVGPLYERFPIPLMDSMETTY